MLHSTIPATEIVHGNVALNLNFDVNFNDTGIASGVKKYTIQASAAKPVLLRARCEIITVFDGAASVLTLGTNAAAANQLLAAADITETAVGFYPSSAAIGLLRIVAPTDIYAKYVNGGGATTGKAKFYLEVLPLFQGT